MAGPALVPCSSAGDMASSAGDAACECEKDVERDRAIGEKDASGDADDEREKTNAGEPAAAIAVAARRVSSSSTARVTFNRVCHALLRELTHISATRAPLSASESSAPSSSSRAACSNWVRGNHNTS